jgi:Uncharacterized protein conserved in bacteria C-term(DUF2220)
VEPPLVRFRILDKALAVNTWTDLSLPPEHFAILPVPVRRVFITENRINGLSFPDCRGSIIVFGLGYGLDRLADIAWMRTVDVHYWGDIDTHGLGILNRLRVHLPHARSFLMNRETLEAHRNLWGQEPLDRRYTGDTSLLTHDECGLFEDLRLTGSEIECDSSKSEYPMVGCCVLFASSPPAPVWGRHRRAPAVRCRLWTEALSGISDNSKVDGHTVDQAQPDQVSRSFGDSRFP